MTNADRETLRRDLFRKINRNQDPGSEALEPDDPRYVQLLGRPELGTEDPVELLADVISLSPSDTTAQLLMGPRGAGKSTQLRRLRRQLRDDGYVVVMADFADHLDPGLKVDIADYTCFLVWGLEQALDEAGFTVEGEGFVGRVKRLLFETHVEVGGVQATLPLGPVGVEVPIAFKSDPDFRAKATERLGHQLPALLEGARAVVAERLAAVQAKQGSAFRGLVFLVDSTEHIRGTLTTADVVQQSVEQLFSVYARDLVLRGIHTVYTIHPYLVWRIPGIATDFTAIQAFTAVKILHRGGVGVERLNRAGIDLLVELVEKRGDWRPFIESQELLEHLVVLSGGQPRLLLDLVLEVLLRARHAPAGPAVIDRVVANKRSLMAQLTVRDQEWLASVLATKGLAPPTQADVPRVAAFLDQEIVLTYANGDQWYDVLPLVAETLPSSTNGSGEPGP